MGFGVNRLNADLGGDRRNLIVVIGRNNGSEALFSDLHQRFDFHRSHCRTRQPAALVPMALGANGVQTPSASSSSR